jgi:NAD(P)-dependent dehydrogenase (short-subunit alcohol dehydrogenase family)
VIAKFLAERGCKLCINYASSLPRAEETLKSLEGTGHVLAKGDAFNRAGIKEIVDQAVAGLGGLDIVISNAGWTKFGAFNDISE